MPALFTLPLSLQWPLWVGVAVVIAAAVQNHFTYRVSNLLTLPAIGAAWLAALVLSAPGAGPLVGGNLASSLSCTFLALGMLLPLYSINAVPAGCVKGQMALSAWIGCALPLALGTTLTVAAVIGGGLVTAAGVYLHYLKHRVTVEKAGPNSGPWSLQHQLPLFPCQITLSLGSLCGIVVAVFWGFI